MPPRKRQAELLPGTIEAISRDFNRRAAEYKASRHTGASLGGGVAWNLQRRAEEVRPGLYAAIGTDVAKLVMRNMVFRKVVQATLKVDPKKEFERNGHDEASLREAWEEIHRVPETPFAVAYGGLDYIVRPSEVRSVTRNWAQDGHQFTRRDFSRKGHTGVIKWFTNNIPAMQELAQPLEDSSDSE